MGNGGEVRRVLEAMSRHLEDRHGFRGLRLESITSQGEAVSYRILPPPFSAPDGPYRVVLLDRSGRPLPKGSRRLTLPEVLAVLEDALASAASGWAVSATRTAGFEARFGPNGLKMAFRSPSVVAPRIPLDDEAGGPVPPLARTNRPTASSPMPPGASAGMAPGASAAMPPGAPPSMPPGAPSPPPPGTPAGPWAGPVHGLDHLPDLLPPEEAAPLLRALDLLGPNGQVRRDDRRKYNQIIHFLRLADPLVRKLPAGREVLIVDCGCGKSQLLFVLNYWLSERLGRRGLFVGLDVEERAVATARSLQRTLGYRNMEFACSSIADWVPPSPPDLVLSLHACDTATDEAIALGVRAGATGILAVPCCQHEIAGQLAADRATTTLGAARQALAPVMAHPILRERLGDWLTDGLRALALEAYGYSVDALEYVSPLDTPKNIMLRAEKARRPDRRAFQHYRALADLFEVSPALSRLLEGQAL